MKKFAILVLTIVLSFQFASAQNESNNREHHLRGEMSYGILSGKMMIGGLEVPKGSESKYLSEKELKKLKSANSVASVGSCMLGAAGGFALGNAIGGGELKNDAKLVLGAIGSMGLILIVAGNMKAEKVVRTYNIWQKGGPETMNLSLMANPAGVGMVLSF